MLEKKEVIDLIQILEDGTLQIRTATIINEDEVEISRTFHRHCKHPNDNTMDKEEQRIQNIANAIWTKDVIQKYKDKIEEINNGI